MLQCTINISYLISNKAFIFITARCTVGRLPPALILPWGLSGFKVESPSKVMRHPVMYYMRHKGIKSLEA